MPTKPVESNSYEFPERDAHRFASLEVTNLSNKLFVNSQSVLSKLMIANMKNYPFLTFDLVDYLMEISLSVQADE